MEGKTVFEHTMAVLRFAKPGFINGLAAIYHDVGKIYPENKNGKIRFIHHEKIGAKIVSQIFPEMKIDNDTTKNVVFLVRNHMKLHQLKDLRSWKRMRKFVAKVALRHFFAHTHSLQQYCRLRVLSGRN
jgi:putative nucleotidyltransferase with HDIG domain